MILIIDHRTDILKTMRSGLHRQCGVYSVGAEPREVRGAVAGYITSVMTILRTHGCMNVSAVSRIKRAHPDIPSCALVINEDVNIQSPEFDDVDTFVRMTGYGWENRAALVEFLDRTDECGKRNVRLGSLFIDAAAKAAYLGGKLLCLTAKEYKMTDFLARNYPFTFIARKLYDHCFASESPVASCVPTHISAINRKSRELFGKNLVVNLRGQGYTINA